MAPIRGPPSRQQTPQRACPTKDPYKFLLLTFHAFSPAKLKQNQKPEVVQNILISRKTHFCCLLPGLSKCTKFKGDLRCSPAVQDAGNRFSHAGGLCLRLEQPKRIHFEMLSHVFFEIQSNSKQTKLLI